MRADAPETEIKKKYIVMVKKYHPDAATENDKKKHNEFMILLNKVYTGGKEKKPTHHIGKPRGSLE